MRALSNLVGSCSLLISAEFFRSSLPIIAHDIDARGRLVLHPSEAAQIAHVELVPLMSCSGSFQACSGCLHTCIRRIWSERRWHLHAGCRCQSLLTCLRLSQLPNLSEFERSESQQVARCSLSYTSQTIRKVSKSFPAQHTWMKGGLTKATRLFISSIQSPTQIQTKIIIKIIFIPDNSNG